MQGTSGLWLTQAQRWDGTSWAYVPSYNYPDTDNYLYGVTTISNTDGWAVGSYSDDGHQHALVLHYSNDANSWVNDPVSVTGSTESVLTAVTSNSSSDVWAVGYYLPNTTGAVYRTLAMHYDGSSWSVVSSPNATPSSSTVAVDNKLYGVSNVPGSSNLFWAVGAYNDDSGNLKTLIMKGDTTITNPPIWNIVSSYNGTGAYNCLRSVSALDSNDAWAVGFQNNLCFDLPTSNDLPSSGNNILIEKWNGSSWSPETPPNALPDDTVMYGISVASSSRVWAVGYYTETIVLGRDSSGAWTRHNSENPSTVEWNRLLAVDVLSDTLAWTAGWYFAGEGGDKPTLIEHYVPPTPTPGCCP